MFQDHDKIIQCTPMLVLVSAGLVLGFGCTRGMSPVTSEVVLEKEYFPKMCNFAKSRHEWEPPARRGKFHEARQRDGDITLGLGPTVKKFEKAKRPGCQWNKGATLNKDDCFNLITIWAIIHNFPSLVEALYINEIRPDFLYSTTLVFVSGVLLFKKSISFERCVKKWGNAEHIDQLAIADIIFSYDHHWFPVKYQSANSESDAPPRFKNANIANPLVSALGSDFFWARFQGNSIDRTAASGLENSVIQIIFPRKVYGLALRWVQGKELPNSQ